MAETFQSSYDRRFQEGFVGGLAMPNWPHKNVLGRLRVDAGKQAPRPGDAVLWHSANKVWHLPTDDDDRVKCRGIIGYNPATLATDSDNVVFKNDDVVHIWLEGVIWCVASAVFPFLRKLNPSGHQDAATVHQWSSVADYSVTAASADTVAETVGVMGLTRFTCLSEDGAVAGGIFMNHVNGMIG